MGACSQWVSCGALEDVSGDVRKPVKMMDPKLPTQAEVDEHNITHLPFRNLCPQCVKGRGRAADHVRQAREDGMMEIHADYCFPYTADKQDKYTLLVAREKATRMTMASLVPMKGGSSEFPVRRLLAFVKELGAEGAPIVFRSDQEPAIKSFVEEVIRRRIAPSFPEFSPIFSSQSNGVAERAVQSVEGQLRTLRYALESRLGVGVVIAPRGGDASSVVAWLTEYSAVLLNRFEVGHNGKTAHERLHMKPSRTMGVEFGETVYWRKAVRGSRDKSLTLSGSKECMSAIVQ